MHDPIKTFEAWMADLKNLRLRDKFYAAVYFFIENSTWHLLNKLSDLEIDVVKGKIFDEFFNRTLPGSFLNKAVSGTRIPAYLIQLIKSRSIDGLRRTLKKKKNETSLEIYYQGEEAQTMGIPDHRVEPAVVLEKKILRKVVVHFLDQLSPLDKSVAELKYVHDLPSREVAKILNLAVTEVYSSTSRIQYAARHYVLPGAA